MMEEWRAQKRLTIRAALTRHQISVCLRLLASDQFGRMESHIPTARPRVMRGLLNA